MQETIFMCKITRNRLHVSGQGKAAEQGEMI